ncbi:MAG: rhomboid family intramembrane serine protease [Planctomycetes bacterium]|nr:rhomboid family intramembrane serine protease [Planctomycetota bacterium]
MIIPIGTDIRTRKRPAANMALIFANVAVYLLTDVFGGAAGQAIKDHNMLYATCPVLYQYITYQFLHGDLLHLAGNMLFLWIFGNAVCDKMGNVCYTLFYLAGGVFSGIMFSVVSNNPIIGASGAIAAVTTGFLVLFPRSRVNMLLIFVFITTFELPSMILITVKIILWDNILAPRLTGAGAVDTVAYSAHLGGYFFGFAAAILMLVTRALPRNQFDVLALLSRWRRRTGFAMSPEAETPYAARPITAEQLDSQPLHAAPAGPAERLKSEILDRIAEKDLPEAARLYMKLTETSERALLSRQAQLDVANQLASMRRHEQAAAAYELFLSAYPTSSDADQVRLLLGLIYNRHLRRHDQAIKHLQRAKLGLGQESQRLLAESELGVAEAHVYGPGSSSA